MIKEESDVNEKEQESFSSKFELFLDKLASRAIKGEIGN